jgi:hypothetical protein
MERQMNKKSIVAVLVVGLIAGSLVGPAEAKKKKKKTPPGPVRIERVVEFEYACPCAGLLQLGTLTGGDPNLGGGAIPVGGDDLYFSAEVADDSGLDVAVAVQQDDGTGANKPTGAFCTSTTEPIALDPGMEVRLFIGGPCGGWGPGAQPVPTAPAGGTITVTLSNMP